MSTKVRPVGCCSIPNDPISLPLPERERPVAMFKALAGPTRLDIFRLVAAREAPICACDLVDRFAVSDVMTQGALPDDLRADMEAWVGCIAGALEKGEYRRLLTEAGFTDVELEVTRVYDPRELAETLGGGDGCRGGSAPVWDESAYARFDASGGKVVSAFVRATKPAQAGGHW